MLADPVLRIGRHWFIFFLLVVFPFLAVWGLIGLRYGLPLHFREDQKILSLASEGPLQFVIATANSPSFFTHAFTAFFAGLFWLLAAVIGNSEERGFAHLSAREEARYLIVRILPVSLLMLYAACFPIYPVIVPDVGGFRSGSHGSGVGEILRCVLGVGIGIAVFTCVALASRVVSRGSGLPRSHVLLALLVILIVALHGFPKLLTVVALFKLCAGVTAFYVLVNLFQQGWRFWAFVGFVCVPLVVGSIGRFKYTFPGMEGLYRCPQKLEENRIGGPAEVPQEKDCSGKEVANLAADLHRPLPVEALDAFTARKGTNFGNRRLVVVSASGGGYRATFWTALVLDRLRTMSRDRTETGPSDLVNYIRLLTGASGGMVGAAYFASLSSEQLMDPAIKLVRLIEQDISERQQQETPSYLRFTPNFLRDLNIPLPGDSLTDVAQQLAFWDSLQIFLPAALQGCLDLYQKRWCMQLGDRGRSLEKNWRQLGSEDKPFTFEMLSARVRAAGAPSLLFSPMIVETGQPLLISDLDLTNIADPAKRNSWDFFSLFPTTWGKLQVGTAARMSASFPYVAPGVDLPIDPPRRVADAGYFDNYGMTTALAYLGRPEVRHWLKENKMDALIIQIDAFPLLLNPLSDEQQRQPECKEPPPNERRGIEGAADWLTGPFEALSAARERSMMFRNEQTLDALRDLYKSEGRELSRIAIENASLSSFSWYLPQQHLTCMEKELSENLENRQAFQLLARLWGNLTPSATADQWDWPRRQHRP
jgi:hypothetical protein